MSAIIEQTLPVIPDSLPPADEQLKAAIGTAQKPSAVITAQWVDRVTPSPLATRYASR